ncbi:MAG TPA: hypothetical protein PKB05_06880 [Oligoflexia bacterium]|nr:hypothetical protein [Oligoflexia bacterium]
MHFNCNGNVFTDLEYSQSNEIFNDGSGINDQTPPGVPTNLTWASDDTIIEDVSGSGSSIQLLFTPPNDNDLLRIEYVVSGQSIMVAPSSGWTPTDSFSNQSITYQAAQECSSAMDSYKVWLRAVDNNNNISDAVVSDIFLQDTLAPQVGTINLAMNAKKNQSPTAIWNLPYDACSNVASLELSIGTGTNQSPPNHSQSGEVADTVMFTNIVSSSTSYQAVSNVPPFTTFSLMLETNYYVSLRVQDDLGNTAIYTSSAWQLPGGPLALSQVTPQFWLDGKDLATLKQDTGCNVDVTSNGDAINCWINKGTDGNNFIKVSGEAEFKSNAPQGAIFDGDIFVAQNVFSGMLDDVLIVLVQTENNSTSSFDMNLNYPFQGSSTGSPTSRYSIHAPWSDRKIYWDTGGCCGSSVRLNTSSPTVNVGETYALGFLNSFAQNSKQIVVNGDVSASTTNVNAGFAANFGLGNGVKNTYHEIIFYTPAPSFSERQDIEGYIACKWDIRNQLPGSHPYFNSNPTSNDGCP